MTGEVRQSTLRGAGYMLAASACFALMGGLVKSAQREMSPFVVVFGRSFMIALIAYGLARIRGQRIRVHNRKTMLWRCVTGMAAMVCYFYTLALLPLATAVALQYASPIFVALLSRRTLGEIVSPAGLAVTCLAFGGMALLVGPSVNALGGSALLAVASALLAALAYVSLRELRNTDDPESIVATFGVFSTVLSAPALAWLDAPPSPEHIALLVGIGVAAYGGQMLMTYAYRVARAAYVSALSYSTVVFGALLGAMAYGERPTGLDIVGMCIILGSGVALSAIEVRADARRKRVQEFA